jgi:hypothetical protein
MKNRAASQNRLISAYTKIKKLKKIKKKKEEEEEDMSPLLFAT